MSAPIKSSYLENPELYCKRINSLLEQNSSEWQTAWKAAIPELFSLPPNNLSVINTLLKPIESAFKSRDNKLRVQAFECWSYLLEKCPKISVANNSEKLWTVFAVPLAAGNHSAYVVLSAKIRTWNSFVEASSQMNQNALKKVIPAILKFLYGPNALDPASTFPKESESCGQLYLKIMKKCSTFVPEINIIFSHLEKAIPPLSNSQNNQKLAKLIWNEALKIMSESSWPPEHFNYLMRTLENLFSDNENDGFQLINNFLAILFDIHGSFPPDRLTPHMNLIIRCLFRPPCNFKVVCDILKGMLKLCENPSFCFYETDRVLMDKIEHDRTDADLLWTAIASCYTKSIKNNSAEIDPSLKILLFPYKYISEISYETKRFNTVMKQWKLCYEECAMSCGSERLIPVLCEKLEADIDKNIPRLIVATHMCNAIFTVKKFSERFYHMKNVLLKIKENMPDVQTLINSELRAFASKYIVTVQIFVRYEEKYREDFSSVFRMFGSLGDSDERLAKADSSKSDADSNSSSKLSNEENCNKMVTPTRKRTSILERWLSPAVKKPDVGSPGRSKLDVGSPCRTSTPKISTIEDDDVQFIAMKPKPKNSPMTQHQLEKAKTKCDIPAMYQDLSQSHSQSLSQTDSENLFIDSNWKSGASVNPELFEENANLPSTLCTSSVTPIIPRTLSFHTGLNSPISEKSGEVLPKISLFNKDEKVRQESDSDSSTEILPENKTSDIVTNNREISDKQPIKRKSLKENETPDDVTPIKRSKRLKNRVENTEDDKKNIKTRKSWAKNDKSTNNKVDGPEIIDVESESNNTVNLIDSVSRASNSLMNLKDNGKSNEKRKSLRKRGKETSYSSLTTRKLRSQLLDAYKNSTDSEDSVSDRSTQDENCIKKKLHVAVVVNHPVQQIEERNMSLVEATASSEEINAGKEYAVVEKNTSRVVTSSTESALSDSVIMVDEGVTEIISIEDSESVGSMKKPEEGINNSSMLNPVSQPIQNSSDESTFYEGSDQNMTNKQPIIVPTAENAIEEIVSIDDQSVTISKPLEVQALPISPEVISSISSNIAVENTNVVDDCAPNESHSNVQSTFPIKNNDETANEEILNEGNKIVADIETSALYCNPNKNSRGAVMTKLAQGPDFPMNTSKSPKLMSPKFTQRIREKTHYPSPNASRSSRILFENNQLPTTPSKRSTPTPIPMQEEGGKCYGTPKGFPGRSILKTPDLKRSDANPNNCSPRSPKLRVSFADKNEIKIFQTDDESDSDSLMSTGDKLSNENLLNEKLQSQDMLYSPLQNCKDNIEELLSYIFSSAGSRQALDYFKSIGIEKVGQLASMSTLTASSIPAGDNRVRRMRRALKKYDEDLEKKQRRRPSTRRSEFKNMEISVLKDLLLEVESTDIDSYGDDEIVLKSDVKNNAPSEETSKEAQNTLVERPVPEELTNISVSSAIDELVENKTENNVAENSKELVIALDDVFTEPKSQPMESEMPIVIGSSESVEKEIVRVENKENVDPHSDVINVDTVSESSDVVEPMEVDEQLCGIPKTTNETINESADFVCTDSTTCEQDVNDRRSITIRDIRQYTTVKASNSKAAPLEKSLTAENPSQETDIVASETRSSTSRSISLFNENKPILQTKKTDKLQEIDVDSQETSISEIDSVIVVPSVDREKETSTVDEQIENEDDENLDIEQNIENRNEKTETIAKNVTIDHSQDEKSSEPNTELRDMIVSVEDTEEFIFRHPELVDAVKEMFPCLELTDDSARKFVMTIFKKVNGFLSMTRSKLRFLEEK